MQYGIGKWILYPDTTNDVFKGEAFGLLHKIVDLFSGVTFHVRTHSPSTVVIPDFESRDPPVFSYIDDIHPGPSTSILIG